MHGWKAMCINDNYWKHISRKQSYELFFSLHSLDVKEIKLAIDYCFDRLSNILTNREVNFLVNYEV